MVLVNCVFCFNFKDLFGLSSETLIIDGLFKPIALQPKTVTMH